MVNKIYDEHTDKDLAYHQKFYLRNKEKLAEQQRTIRVERKKNDPAGYMITRLRGHAKNRGIEFDLTKDDLILPRRCPVFQIPLYFTEGKITWNTPTVDRLDNNLGYVKDNVRVISWRANKMKSNMSLDEIRRLVAYMEDRL